MSAPAFQLTRPPQPRATAAPRRVKCDERCRHAKGPDCNCKCGGLYHGAAWRDDATLDLFTDEDRTP